MSVGTSIPLSVPSLGGREAEYLQACIESGWVSGNGPFTRAFEDAFAARHGRPAAVATASGTAALHVALAALGVGPGDEVIVPDLTFIATANPVRYVGATPVLADVDPVTYTLDPERLGEVVGPRTRAIVVVHLYGHPADMDPLLTLAREHGLAVVEDATEALGSAYRDRACGTLGDVGCFSFNGNKVITTGGGGMVVAREPETLERMRYLTLQAREPGSIEYLHGDVGFNYVMSNLQGAVGLAQIERLDELLAGRQAVAARYAEGLADVDGLTYAPEAPWARSNRWLGSVLVDPERYGEDRRALAGRLADGGVESRPFFHPLHALPPYRDCRRAELRVSSWLHERGLSLPSSADLLPAEQERVVSILRREG